MRAVIAAIVGGAGPNVPADVDRLARRAKLPGPVEVSYLMGPAAKTHRFQDAVARLERQGVSEIVVVPMLVSSFLLVSQNRMLLENQEKDEYFLHALVP